jgi:protein-tyrosine phosphatase
MSSGFEIDILPLGAGALGLCPMPGRHGDPAGDLVRIGAFRPALVVSLTLVEEMASHGIDDLPDRLAEAGINWRHFPIGDFGVPQPEADPVWRAVAAEVRGALDGGGRVLIHCKAGRGRTGTVALRLMIEAGEHPPAALARLRAARPGTVETPAQQRWAEAGRGAHRAP